MPVRVTRLFHLTLPLKHLFIYLGGCQASPGIAPPECTGNVFSGNQWDKDELECHINEYQLVRNGVGGKMPQEEKCWHEFCLVHMTHIYRHPDDKAHKELTGPRMSLSCYVTLELLHMTHLPSP